MSTFDFSTPYTKTPDNKLSYVLYEITDFAFKRGVRDYVTVCSSENFWSRSKSKTERSYFLQEIKSSLEFLINNSFFQVRSKILRQVIGIPKGSETALFFAKVFFCFFMNLDG